MTDEARLPDVSAYRLEGEEQLESGSPLVAYDLLAEGLGRFPQDLRLRQLLALALARTGASRPASKILEALASEGHADEETLGLLARTHKDLWADSADPTERRRHLDRAHEYYCQAYRLTNGIWSGINAATTALLLGDREQAAALARAVREHSLAMLDIAGRPGDEYWVLATLGEAALILGDQSEAENRYSQAASTAGHRLADRVSTRRNARLILRHLEADTARIDACFQIPRVAVFIGHLIDRPGRASPRFPPSLEAPVRNAIRERLEQLDVGFGYASAGCGSDILFHECLHEMKAESRVVLPYDRDQFLQDSVAIVPGSDWPERYQRVLGAAHEVVTASDQRMREGPTSFEYGFLLLDGSAAIRADELDTDLVSVAVWNGMPGDGPGGTESAVSRWRGAGRQVHIIDLAAIAAQHSSDGPRATSPTRSTPRHAAPSERGGSVFKPEIVALLFGDAHGFSHLTEEEIPPFVNHFLGAIAAELARSPHLPVLKNTWGDGLYMVFRSVRDTGLFALGLCDTLESIDWTSRGFSKELSLRIGLHAGPAYACMDPVTDRPNYLGAHVSRAARIEPITPPGQVYASGAFAAIARAERVREFGCAYVGQVPFAKGYGTFPTYRVYRRRDGC